MTDDDLKAYVGPVVRMFRAGLGRLPEPNALSDFTARMRDGMTPAELARVIAGSAEFIALNGSEDVCDALFLDQLFHHALDRSPSPADRAALQGQGSRADLLNIVADSVEAQERLDLLDELYPDGAAPNDDLAYALWVKAHDTPDQQDLRAIGQQIDLMRDAPLISLVVAAATSRPDLLLETIGSLDAQLYPRWELCVALPGDMPAAGRADLEAVAARVPGIVLVDRPGAGGNDALLQPALDRATGGFVGFLDPGDRLAVTALYEIASALQHGPQIDLLYTDEDSIDGTGRRSAPLLKPGWSQDMLLAGDTVGQLAVIRRSRVIEAGGLRADAGTHVRYDLLLRAAHGLAPGAISHLGSVLYHRGRMPGRPLPFPRARSTAVHPDLLAATSRHLRETGQDAVLQDAYVGGGVWPRVVFPLAAAPPRVSVLVRTHDDPDELGSCVAGLLERTRYDAIEVVVADPGLPLVAMRRMLRRLSRHPAVRIEAVDKSAGRATQINRMAALATGDVLVLMDDRVEATDPDWLDEMVRQIGRPGVGIVGPRLLYEDGSLQHGGIVLQTTGPVRVLRSAQGGQPGYLGQLALSRDMSAVSGACLAVRRDVFEAAGGLDAAFWSHGDDVDLCLKVARAGHRVVWTPHAVLTYRGPDSTTSPGRSSRDLDRLRDRWSLEMTTDPFLNVNLEATRHALILAMPPRRTRPWQPARDLLDAAMAMRSGREHGASA